MWSKASFLERSFGTISEIMLHKLYFKNIVFFLSITRDVILEVGDSFYVSASKCVIKNFERTQNDKKPQLITQPRKLLTSKKRLDDQKNSREG